MRRQHRPARTARVDIGFTSVLQTAPFDNDEVDDGEDVLVKKHHGARDFIATIVENSARGVRIGVGAE